MVSGKRSSLFHDKQLDPFGGPKPRLLRRGKEVPLRVNPERSTELTPKSSPDLQAGESKGWRTSKLPGIFLPVAK